MTVVVLSAVDPVRLLVVHRQTEEVRSRLVIETRPGLTSVQRHSGSPVPSVDHSARVVRIDPKRMMVPVLVALGFERPAPVRGLEEAADGQDIDDVGILGVGGDVIV